MRILLDLDEVLCDFTGGICKAHGTTSEEMEKYRIPGNWSIVEALGKAIGEELDLEDFWARVEGSHHFWAGLDPLPWMKSVVDLVSGITDDWHIVTAPSRCQSSYSGKVDWIKTFFGDEFDRFCITPHKEIFANPSTVLIDDREENLTKFRLHGGLSILFPTRGNRAHALAKDPVSYVSRTLTRGGAYAPVHS